MLQFPEIDPVLLHLGSLQLHWYGLMYVLGFIGSFFLVKQQLKRFNFKELQEHFNSSLNLFGNRTLKLVCYSILSQRANCSAVS